jgi:hypothetical protein
MLSTLSQRLSYANVMATLAMVLALGTGGAYAATRSAAPTSMMIIRLAGFF